MKTRNQQRMAEQRTERAPDGDKPNEDPLVRPAIRGSRRETITETKEAKPIPKSSKSFNEGVSGKEDLDESVRRTERRTTRSRSQDSQEEENRSQYSRGNGISDSEEENTGKDRSSRSSDEERSHRSFSRSKDGEESDEELQTTKDSRRENSLNKTTSYGDHADQYRDRLRQRKAADNLPNYVTGRPFSYVADEKKSFQKSRSSPSTHGIVRDHRNYNTPISAVGKKPLKKETAMFSEDEMEEKPRQKTGSGALQYSKEKKSSRCVYVVVVLLLVGALLFSCWHLFLEKLSSQKAEDKLQIFHSFHGGFRKLPILFPSQSPFLWQRSQRMLESHLNRSEENQGPAIILLTAAQGAKQVLYCVGNQLAGSYASARNSGYTVLSGADAVSGSSEEVKMHIDNRLTKGFQTNKAAVLHQLELLPPASLLILYKYCDHENAAFPNVALVLTVLLNDDSLSPDINLGDLEERVHDFLKKTFISSRTGTSHNDMDGDKLSGVWSRIAHVVLPVMPEKSIPKECQEPAGKEEKPGRD